MNYKKIYQIASMGMALLMILGNTIQTQAAISVAQSAGPSIYWGANLGQAPTNADMAPGGAWDIYETHSKKKMSIIHWGESWQMSDGSWGEFQTSFFDNVRSHGSIPMITWGSQRLGAGVNQANFQLRDIYGGTYDPYITRWATAAKNWGHPFFLRFEHEMNGWWYPWGEGITSTGAIVNGNSAGDFVKAWRHVHDIFTSVGATNVTWVWAPNQIGNSSKYPDLSTIYPGDAYVDWTGFSVYNKYSTWLGLNPLLTASGGVTWLKNSYNIMQNVAPNKPMMLAEWASLEAGDGGAKKAAWIKDALNTQIPTNFPKIKAVVWFNSDMGTGQTYPIESSQASIDAWAAGIASTVYATNQYANLNTSPIPALVVSSPAPTATLPISTPTTVTPTAAPTGSATLIAVADSYIDGANPGAVTGGTATSLYVDGSPVRKTFLKFDLTPLAGKTISTVKLTFKTTSNSIAGSANSSNIKLVDGVDWKEQYLSYNNPVPISTTVLGTVPTNTVPNTWYTITLTPSAIQQKVGGLLSVAIESAGSDELIFYSREAADKPQLIITYK